MPADGYPFPTPKAPTGPISDTPEWRAYAEFMGYDADGYDEPFKAFLLDETACCERCDEWLLWEDLNDGLCGDCNAMPTRASRRMRDPDERASL